MRQEGTEECDKRERKDETGGDGRRKREGRKSCKGIGSRRRDLTIIKLIRQPRGGTRRVVPS